MAMVLKAPEKTFDLIPEDSYAAVCVGLVDNGVAYNNTYNKDQRQVTILWELEYENEDGEAKRGVVSNTYTFSFHEKSSLRKVLKSWRGREFTPDELQAFDLKNVLKCPCLLQIIHNESSNGNTYANVGNISKLPKSMTKPDITKEIIYFDCEESDLSMLEKLPQYLSDRIKNSKTYKDRIQCDDAGDTFELEDDEDGELPF